MASCFCIECHLCCSWFFCLCQVCYSKDLSTTIIPYGSSSLPLPLHWLLFYLSGACPFTLGQVPLAQPYIPRSHFNQLIVVDEVEGLFQAHDDWRRQADCDIGSRGAYIGLLLLFTYVDNHIHRPRIQAHNHSLVHRSTRLYERIPPLLSVLQPLIHSPPPL